MLLPTLIISPFVGMIFISLFPRPDFKIDVSKPENVLLEYMHILVPDYFLHENTEENSTAVEENSIHEKVNPSFDLNMVEIPSKDKYKILINDFYIDLFRNKYRNTTTDSPEYNDVKKEIENLDANIRESIDENKKEGPYGIYPYNRNGIANIIKYEALKKVINRIDQESAMKKEYEKNIKLIALVTSLLNLMTSLIVWILYNNSSKYFQFIQEHNSIGYYDFYLGVDGLSIYFVLLTTIIMPISIISNWKSIKEKVIYFLMIMLLLESLLLLIYMVLDLLMFYIFFESILAPLFILIGIFGSVERQRASYYFFLYTFLGSLFMLLSIITVSFLSGCTDISIISKNGFIYMTQLLMFIGIFIAFAVKTPVIYLNGWLLKAHVESPLSGSIILAAIVLKLSLYGIFRLILILSPKAYTVCTYIIFTIGVITIIYASLSTLRTIDIKELIAYSSVSHAAVYFIGVFSNVIQGIIGGICLGLAHGFVSSGLFAIVGGILYDRSGTRLISHYRGLVQAMPILSTLFFILCLGNCGAPLTLNFIGEFMSLYGVFERLPLAGIFASSSIVFSAAFTIFMFNRIIFGGSLFKRNWGEYMIDLNLREYSMLLVLVIFTVTLGIYPSIITDGLNYVSQGLLFTFENVKITETITFNDSPEIPESLNNDFPYSKKSSLLDLIFFIGMIIALFDNKEIDMKQIKNSKSLDKYIIKWYNFCKKKYYKNGFFHMNLMINTLIIIILSTVGALLLIMNNYIPSTVINWVLISKCLINIIVIINLVNFFKYILRERCDIITLNISKNFYKDRLINLCLLLIVFILLISFQTYVDQNIRYDNLKSLFLYLSILILISFAIFNFFFKEKTDIYKIFSNIWKMCKDGSIISYIISIIKTQWLMLVICGSSLIFFRYIYFPWTGIILEDYFVMICLVRPIYFLYRFFNLLLFSKSTLKIAFSNSLINNIKISTHTNILIGLIMFSIFMYIKMYVISYILVILVKGISVQIPWYKLKIDISCLQKFFLENKNNIFRFNITKFKFSFFFKCFTGITKISLTYNFQIKNSIINNPSRSYVTPPQAYVNLDDSNDNDELNHIESSPNILEHCPPCIGIPHETDGNIHDYVSLGIKNAREDHEMIQLLSMLDVPQEVRAQMMKDRVTLAQHIVRHYDLRETELGLGLYANLLWWATNDAPAWYPMNLLAKKVLCQDDNLAISLESFKHRSFVTAVQSTRNSDFINVSNIMRIRGPALLDELRIIRKDLRPDEIRSWTYQSAPINNFGATVSMKWTVGDVGLNQNHRLSLIESTRLNGNISQDIITANMSTRDPNGTPLKIGGLLYQNKWFAKYTYNHHHHVKVFYKVSDPQNITTKPFDPNNPYTPEVARNFSFVLEDGIRSGLPNIYKMIDNRALDWCAEALDYRDASSRSITTRSVLALRDWKYK